MKEYKKQSKKLEEEKKINYLYLEKQIEKSISHTTINRKTKLLERSDQVTEQFKKLMTIREKN